MPRCCNHVTIAVMTNDRTVRGKYTRSRRLLCLLPRKYMLHSLRDYAAGLVWHRNQKAIVRHEVNEINVTNRLLSTFFSKYTNRTLIGRSWRILLQTPVLLECPCQILPNTFDADLLKSVPSFHH